MEQELNFGLKIKQLIESRRHTYEEAASIIGVTRSTVHRWTTLKDLGTDVLRQVCKAYQIEFSYFLSSANYTQNAKVVNAGINAVGEKIMNYGTVEHNSGVSPKNEVDNKILIERLKSCEEKNALLERMIKILESK
ncbi:helix-turn-helix domain-containing protein [Runella limosa]|uniref:helix-turn-helix domain-containing protein n=1 Tax=Runella limosa TaxID=370978 RepID=UPI0004268F16|nr:helix-turn-helix transcriptional regulator [Runella limosa]